MMCGLEAVAQTKRKEANLKLARFSLRMIRMYRNEYTGTV